jgi:hypothetical protein
MSNSFPSVPTDLQLQSVVYTLNFGGDIPTPGPALTFDGVGTGLWGAISSLGGQGGVAFTFDTPGDAGSFDQEAAEAQLASIVTDIFQLMSDLTGVPVATLASSVTVNRRWTWTDATGSQATYTDTMTYPPAA